MKLPRQLAIWGAAALLSLAGLGVIMKRQFREIQGQVAVQVPASPVTGGAVFRNKGCGNCHGASGAGTEFGLPLRNRQSLTNLPELVTTLWNHAPRMWREMEAKGIPYPSLSYAETAQLATFLYMSGYVDGGGDPTRGEHLFRQRKCARCHSAGATSGKRAPSVLALANALDPLAWTQALWNHASGMQTQLKSNGANWPQFQGGDLGDLFSYLRNVRNLGEDPPPDVGGDPDHGWVLFQKKGCIDCHELSSDANAVGPSLGPDHKLPPTFSEFGAALLNHFPNMEATMKARKLRLPQFENHDLADVAVFLYSLHYLEPTGSPQVGKSIFAWRGCSRCHGENGEGTSSGPPLRGRGHVYTAVRLASALWGHGGRMYESSREHDQPWPTLRDSDIGHLLMFLNTSLEH